MPAAADSSRRGHSARRVIVAVITVVIVIVVSAWAVVRLKQTDLCAPARGAFRVVHFDGECVGTTDGSFVFDPRLKSVEQDIKGQNTAAVRSGNYVSVALLTPMTTHPGSVISMSRIIDELDGAYAEQYAANSSSGGPKIQLVLANEGSDEQAWHPVATMLAGMAGGPAHLVAVTGMGVSETPTQDGARLLRQAGLLMVASVITADNLNWQHIFGLTTVVPDDAQQVTALGSYLRSRRQLPPPGNRNGFFLVYSGQGSDMYTSSLHHDFKSVLGRWISHSSPYGPPGMSGQLSLIAGDVCAVPAAAVPTVLYAGRENLLPGFLHSLRKNALCQHRSLTVITASDAAALPPSVTAPAPVDGSLTVIYSDLFDPAQVTQPTRSTFQASALHSASSLSGTWTIGAYNSTAAAVAAIDLAYNSNHAALPAARTLRYVLLDLSGQNAVSGATGPFGFSSPGGDLLSPQIPVMQLAGGADPTLAP